MVGVEVYLQLFQYHLLITTVFLTGFDIICVYVSLRVKGCKHMCIHMEARG